MAITYPRDLRNLADAGIAFIEPSALLINERVATARLPNAVQAVEIAPRVWSGAFTTQPLDDDQYRLVDAFLSSLGGAKQVLIFNPKFSRPAAAGLPATTSATIVTATSITLALTSGLVITNGDHIGLEQGGRYGLFKALETVTAVSGAATVTVSPQVPSYFTGGATARLIRPVCRAILDPSQPYRPALHAEAQSLSFSCIQVGF
jgi:hypothetical protein